jgi:hypothetical protein
VVILTFLPLILTYFMFAIPAFIVVVVIGYLVRRLSLGSRIAFVVLASTLLLTPSLGPATIAVVPVPFGLLLVFTIVDGDWGNLANWVTSYSLWHTVAFPATAVVSYVVVRLLPPNNSFKPKPLRGSA